ncbi:MAG: hypothetical protein ACK5LX_16185 [Oscillospiraceae bacterium]
MMLEELLRRNREAFRGKAAKEEVSLLREEVIPPPVEMPAGTSEGKLPEPLWGQEETEIVTELPIPPAEIDYPAGRGERVASEEAKEDVLEQVTRRISWRSRMLPQDMNNTEPY